MTNIVAHQGKFNRVERDNKNPMFSMGIPEKMKGSDFARSASARVTISTRRSSPSSTRSGIARTARCW